LGAGRVVAIDVVPERLKLAESLGAIPVNPKETDPEDVVRGMTDWRGADVVVDAVGHESALASTFNLVRQGGTISLPGMYIEDSASVPIGDMWLKNITVMAGVANIQGHMDELLELIRDGRIDRLCRGLESLGVRQGDRVATFAWNSQEHLELYLGTPCMGAVLHTLNIRLFPDQLTYIANHAEDSVVFVDDSLVPVLEKV